MQTAATIESDRSRFLLVEQFDANAIGQRIKHARIEAGMTQEDLADLAEGFGRRSLQAYETGESIPFKHLREIGVLLNKETAWFLYGDPEPPSSTVEDRLQELADAVSALANQLVLGATSMEVRLEAIENRLPPPPAGRQPRPRDRTGAGGHS